MCQENYGKEYKRSSYPDGYWDAVRRSRDAMSYEERRAEERKREEDHYEKHRVW